MPESPPPHRPHLRFWPHRPEERDQAARLRGLVRGSEVAVVLLAILLGAIVGLAAWALEFATSLLHALFFGVAREERLSIAQGLDPLAVLLVPALGGMGLALLNRALARRLGAQEPVDPIEANALHGGRMPLRDTAMVAGQTVLSNGVGASVGLEAAYAQVGGGIASRLGAAFSLRRADLRVLVGAGTAGAIGAVFEAPLTGAFYAFELVIGSYSVAALFPVIACAVTALLVTRGLETRLYPIQPPIPEDVALSAFPLAMLLGALCALLGIALMRGVVGTESFMRQAMPNPVARLGLAGLLVGMLALVNPVALSSGHGALGHGFVVESGAELVLTLLLVKVAAVLLSLGSGFRGGIFFASLLLGALVGKLFGTALAPWVPGGLDPVLMAMVGMSALGNAVLGAPLALTFLVLETTGRVDVAGVVLAAVALTGLMVRRLFGFSFATWRFHLRGEAIRSAMDIGWVNDLTVDRMMRRDVPAVAGDMTLATFRQHHPLGSAPMVAALDPARGYVGLVSVPEAHAAPDPGQPVSTLARHADVALLPGMNATQAMAVFAAAEADLLVVVGDAQGRHVVGMLAEAFVLRRYGEELEKRRREEAGLG